MQGPFVALCLCIVSAHMSDKIYDTGFREASDRMEAYADFVAVVRQLRQQCPWDREQTHASVKHLLIEEAYETVSAIENEDWGELKKELGDLLLHVVFHCVMAEESGRFTTRDVMEAEIDKLVRRHPHVFGDTSVSGVEEVLTNWESIKRADEQRQSVLEGVPKHLPTLLAAYRMQEKAAGIGFDFIRAADAWQKVEEEISEAREAINDAENVASREAEFGDLLFSLVNYARFAGVNPENALRRTNRKFRRRIKHIERCLSRDGRSMEDATLVEMDYYWEEAKQMEHAP